MFVHTPALTEVPPDLPPGPYRQAVELAKEATFTPQELSAYRKVRDEIQQAREYGAAQRAEGEAVGFAKGEAAGQARTILTILAARGIAVDDKTRARIMGCADMALLDTWAARAVTATTAADVLDPAL